jgi:hypothetical protein
MAEHRVVRIHPHYHFSFLSTLPEEENKLYELSELINYI